MRLESEFSSAASAPQGSAITVGGDGSETKRFLRHGLRFALIGLLIYAGVYAVAEQLVYKNTVRNRFHAVKTASASEYDYVILGASHAVALDYEDMTARLEEMTGSRILNLSAVGSGVTVNRVILDYFLARHQTSNVIYFADSFAFYSREWNEERLKDTRLYDRAPFDLRLAWLLLRNPSTRSMALDYIVGFSKINNADRFKPDISEDEATKFDKTYRPVKQIDRQRIEYLYAKQIDQDVLDQYMTEFEDLIGDLQSRDIRLIVIKPPIPGRMYDMIPDEERFDEALSSLLERYGVEFHDLSLVMDDEQFYYNSDHLNRTGVLHFFENYLRGVMFIQLGGE